MSEVHRPRVTSLTVISTGSSLHGTGKLSDGVGVPYFDGTAHIHTHTTHTNTDSNSDSQLWFTNKKYSLLLLGLVFGIVMQALIRVSVGMLYSLYCV